MQLCLLISIKLAELYSVHIQSFGRVHLSYKIDLTIPGSFCQGSPCIQQSRQVPILKNEWVRVFIQVQIFRKTQHEKITYIHTYYLFMQVCLAIHEKHFEAKMPLKVFATMLSAKSKVLLRNIRVVENILYPTYCLECM